MENTTEADFISELRDAQSTFEQGRGRGTGRGSYRGRGAGRGRNVGTTDVTTHATQSTTGDMSQQGVNFIRKPPPFIGVGIRLIPYYLSNTTPYNHKDFLENLESNYGSENFVKAVDKFYTFIKKEVMANLSMMPADTSKVLLAEIVDTSTTDIKVKTKTIKFSNFTILGTNNINNSYRKATGFYQPLFDYLHAYTPLKEHFKALNFNMEFPSQDNDNTIIRIFGFKRGTGSSNTTSQENSKPPESESEPEPELPELDEESEEESPKNSKENSKENSKKTKK